MKKFFVNSITVLMIITLFMNCAYATTFPTMQANSTNGGAATNTIKTILGVIQFVGYVIAVGMLIYIGIKYIMASANEKADLKSSLVKYVVGAVLIAGGATIANWVFTALSTNE